MSFFEPENICPLITVSNDEKYQVNGYVALTNPSVLFLVQENTEPENHFC